MTNQLEPMPKNIDIKPLEAWDMLVKNNDTILVDVRTNEEWQLSGYPNLDAIKARLIKLTIDENFSDNLPLEIENKLTQILFVCQSGIRSKKAMILMNDIGYQNCYNVIGGAKLWQESALPWKRD